MSSIVKLTKTLYSCLTDDNGMIINRPTGELGKRNLPDIVISFFVRYLDFVLNSKILNTATKIYITGPGYQSAEAVFIDFNRKNPDQTINVKTAISNMDYCRKKIIKYFDEDMLKKLIFYSSEGVRMLPHYEEQLTVAMQKFNRSSAFESFTVIELSKQACVNEPCDDQIDCFIEAISGYRRASMKQITEYINNQFGDVIGYYNYLSCKETKTQECLYESRRIPYIIRVSSVIDHGSEREQLERHGESLYHSKSRKK